MKKYAIIVAGGSGSRMGTEIAKQFLLINGLPILVHTLQKFLQYSDYIQVIVVLPQKDFSLWESLAAAHQSIIQAFHHPIRIAAGGPSRFQSVRNGLACIEDSEGLVAIHDAVRPCVTLEIIQKSFEEAAIHGTAVACVPLKDSARVFLENGENVAVDRSRYRLVQTPQTFRLNLIKNAYQYEEQSYFTDCASVAEHAGNKIHLIDGSYENIKITTPEDLILAERFLS